MLRQRKPRRPAQDQTQLMVDRTQERVTFIESNKVLRIQGTGVPQPPQRRSRCSICFIILYVVTQLQVAGSKVNVEHAAGAVLDVAARIAPRDLFLLQTIANASRLGA